MHKRIMFGSGEALCEDVSNVVIHGNVWRGQVFILNMVTNKMVANINVFRTSVESRVLGKSDCAMIVTVNGSWEWKGVSEFREK